VLSSPPTKQCDYEWWRPAKSRESLQSLSGGGVAKELTLCTLSERTLLTNHGGHLVYLQQVKNVASGTFTMRVTYSGGNAWVGIGTNTEGQPAMFPGKAVVGRVDASGESTVLYYDLSSDQEDASGVQPVNSSSLYNATFEQPDDTTSILTFTQDLSAMDITDSSMWIFGVGLPNNVWGGHHKVNGAFRLPLTDNCQEGGLIRMQYYCWT
jgi:hypothetical protein